VEEEKTGKEKESKKSKKKKKEKKKKRKRSDSDDSDDESSKKSKKKKKKELVKRIAQALADRMEKKGTLDSEDVSLPSEMLNMLKEKVFFISKY
jgi:dGTP triphosphohydrolase